MAVQEPAEAVKPADAGVSARETLIEIDIPEPGMRRREVRLSDGRYMVYYEFERRG